MLNYLQTNPLTGSILSLVFTAISLVVHQLATEYAVRLPTLIGAWAGAGVTLITLAWWIIKFYRMIKERNKP